MSATPSLLETFRASISDKADLQSQIVGLTERAVSAEADRDLLQTQIDTHLREQADVIEALTSLRGDLEGARTEVTRLSTDLATARAAATTVADQTIETVAALGFPAADLPASTDTATGGSLAEQFDAISDPAARTAFYEKHRTAIRGL